MKIDKFIKALGSLVLDGPYATGSRVICPDDVTDKTDWDFVIRVGFKDFREVKIILIESGMDLHHHEEYLNGCVAVFMARGVHLMITVSQQQYDGWIAATKASRYLNMSDKDQRVALFNLIHSFTKPSTFLPHKPKKARHDDDIPAF